MKLLCKSRFFKDSPFIYQQYLIEPENFIENILQDCCLNENNCWIWTKRIQTNSILYPFKIYRDKQNRIKRVKIQKLIQEFKVNDEVTTSSNNLCGEILCCNPDHIGIEVEINRI